MKRWNVEVKETRKNEKSAVAAMRPQKQTWTAIIDGLTFFSFESYEDLMEKIREYRESK